MNRYYYKKTKTIKPKKIIRVASLLIFFAGLLVFIYVFFPLISWHIYFAPIFASYDVAIPIPQTTVITKNELGSLVSQVYNLKGVDYTNAKNWFPTFKTAKGETQVSTYTLSIPKLGIKNAAVSANDYDLGKHLVNYPGTSIPPNNGNAIIFGHSTLPQLFNPSDYKAIFATLYTLQIGDEILVNMQQISYKYKVISLTVVNPNDTSLLSEQFDNAYLTLITCTPPGTTWKRLLIKTRLEKI